jgi:hypothetical protein
MNLFRKFSLIAIFAIGLFGVQYHLLTSWKSRRELEYQQLDLVAAALDQLRLDPNLVNSVNPAILREVASQLGRQLLQILPECIPPSSTSSPPSPKAANQALPKLYIITPTYRRPEQLPEMTRLSQTLLHVKNIKWLVIEDATVPTTEITELLKRTGFDYEHLIGKRN